MKRMSLLLLTLLTVPVAMAQDAPAPDSAYLAFIKERAAALRADEVLPDTLEAWNAQRESIRAKLIEAWGGFPTEDCPLEPKILDTLQRDGYRVEKLIFQTMPDIWMTANAYVPDGPGPFPAVLCVHGHWPGAKQDPHVQARAIGLAKLGYFALAVDAFGAGERGVGKALGEYHGDMTAATLWPTGRALTGVQAYENRRAVDYLQSRPEVDGGRLGVTGASGGGNQTMYAGATDERFNAVVPVCSVGNYQSYISRACCMCEVVPGVLTFTEEWGVLGLTAPRGLMVINATQDAPQFSVEEAKKSLAKAAPVYQLYDKPGHLRHAIFESGHDYNQAMREAMYGWMAWHLKGEGDGSPIPEPAMETEEPEALRCFPGETRPDDWMTLPMFAAREGRQLVERIARPDTAEAWRDQALAMRTQLDQEVLGRTTPSRGSREPVTPVLATSVGELKGKGRIALTLSLTESVGLEEGSLAMNLTADGYTVVPVQLRATGAHVQPNDAIGRAPDHNTAEWALWTDQPLLGQWVVDVRAAIDQLAAAGAVLDDLHVAGSGPAGVVALCAAALDERIQETTCVKMLVSYTSDTPYEGQRLGIMAPGVLKQAGDIQHIAALVSPRRINIIEGVNGAGQVLEPTKLIEAFSFARAVYTLTGAGEGLTIRPVPGGASDSK